MAQHPRILEKIQNNLLRLFYNANLLTLSPKLKKIQAELDEMV